MKNSKAFLAACAIWSLSTFSVAAQSYDDWFERAELLRREGTKIEDIETARDIHFRLLKSGYSLSLVPFAEIQLEMKNVEIARKAFEEAANAGDLYAITRLAQLHATSAFGENSMPEDGVELLRKLANNPENTRAIFAMAEVLADGQIVEADPAAALELYSRLPENRTAQRRIAQLHMSGELGKVDAEAAIPAYQKAIELGTDTLRVRLASAQIKAQRFDDAVETLETAIAAGDERALLQMMRWNRDGSLGPRSDPGRALAALQELVETGAVDDETYHKFRVSLAEQQLEERQFRDAAATIAPAVAAGYPQAVYRFMRWHIEKRLGNLSDPVAGATALRELIEDGDVRTAVFASFRLQDEFYAPLIDRNEIFAILTDAAEDGNGAATRALARAYRAADIKGPHRILIERYAEQIDPEDRVTELIYASYDPKDLSQLRDVAGGALAQINGDAFVRGMMQIRSLDRSSYVYILQEELAKLGFYDGQQNGKLTSRTIKSMLDFCRSVGIIADCRSGPISSENSRLIVEAVARRKRV